MSDWRQRKKAPTATATELLTELRIQAASEIDIELIAAHCGLLVEFKVLPKEEGHLVHSGGSGIISVNHGARRTEKWRFVIAHEIGHFKCHASLDQSYLCDNSDLIEAYRGSGHEAEANVFAAELLMPELLFRPRCDCKEPSLDVIRSLASEFRTSLTSTGLRFVEWCPEPCAVVHSTDGVIDWWRKSNDFVFTLRKGHRLTRATYAGDLFADRPVDDRPQELQGNAWSDDSRADGLDIAEHSMKLGGFNSVLTILRHEYQDIDDE